MMSVIGRASTIVQAMQAGAADYLTKPFEEVELDAALDRIGLRRSRAERRPRFGASRGAIGARPLRPRCVRSGVIEQIGDTDVTVLIQGESGVGKEIVAREIHARRAGGPAPSSRSTARPSRTTLLESELFGYESGAFTGAGRDASTGKFEQADERHDLPRRDRRDGPALQAKLLQRAAGLASSRDSVGTARSRSTCGSSPRRTARSRGWSLQGRFREDLYFRLNVVDDRHPAAARAPRGDPAAGRALPAAPDGRATPVRRGGSRRVSCEAIKHYPFPGNVRELENMIKRIVVLESEEPGAARSRRGRGSGAAAAPSPRASDRGDGAPRRRAPAARGRQRASLEVERSTIERVLFHTHWNRKQAARILGVCYKTLLLKIRECGLEAD